MPFQIRTLLVLSIFFNSFFIVLAQETTQNTQQSTQQTQEQEAGPQAVIKADKTAAVEKNVIFDASKSIIATAPETTTYHWNFGDGSEKDGLEVVHIYKKSGQYHITLEIKNEQGTFKAEDDIFIYRKFVLLLTDKNEKKSQIESLATFAENEGVYLKILDAYESASEFISEEALSKKISENIDSLTKADEMIIWTDGNAGLNAIGRITKDNQELTPADLSKKIFLIVKDRVSKIRLSKQLQLTGPKQIFVAKEASVYPFIQSTIADTFLNLERGGYEFIVIDEESQKLQIWNFMTYFVNNLIDSGIPDNIILLILMVPIIATIVVMMKQVIGLTTFGMYTPLILTLIFFILGIKFGLLILILFIGIGTITRLILKKTRLLYFPKLGIMVTIIALSLFIFLIIGTFFNFFDSQFFSLAIFPMLILGTLTEKFSSVQSIQSFWANLKITLETLLVSVLAYIAIGGEVDMGFMAFKWDFLQNIVRSTPEIVFVFIIVNILLGRWTGLRLLEYVRFREILRHEEEE